MSNHYSDYLKKSVSVSDLVFDKVQESDKDVIKRVKKAHIKANMLFIVLLGISCVTCLYYVIRFCFLPLDNFVYQAVTQSAFGAAVVITGYFFYGFFRSIKEIRRGVVLASTRSGENPDGRNAAYQFVFDIYMEDRDETLMCYTVDREVSSAVQPGDGVIIAKCGKKIKVFEDPDRKQVMDVSKIKSGIG